MQMLMVYFLIWYHYGALTFFIWNKAIKTISQIHLLNFFIRTVSEQHDGEYMTEIIFYVRYFSAISVVWFYEVTRSFCMNHTWRSAQYMTSVKHAVLNVLFQETFIPALLIKKI